MPYIGRSTDGFGVRNRFLYLASASDTSVSGADANGATLTFTDGAYVDVYLNGVLLKAGTDYNTNTANTIAGLASLAANDEVTVIVYDVFTVGDMVSATSGGTFVGNVAMSGTLGVTGATTTAAITASGVVDITDTTDASDATGDTGALRTEGGASIAKKLYVGTDLDVDGTANLDVVDIDGAVDMASTLAVGSDVTIRNSSSTGPSLNIGTTNASVANGGYIGGIMFDAGSASSGTARIQVLSNGQTDAGATGTGADFSFECRDNGQSFSEKVRFTGDGKVGIGTTNPLHDLQINTAAPEIQLEETSSGGSKRLSLGVESDGTPFISAEQSGGQIEVQLSGNPEFQFLNGGRFRVTRTGVPAYISRGPVTGVTVDNGSTTSVAGNSGVLYNMVMVSTGGGFGAVYSMAYNSTVQLIHGTGNFSASSGTSSSTNVYKSSASHAVTLQNNTGSAVTYYILILSSYD